MICYVVFSEWGDDSSGSDCEINGIYTKKEDAIDKMNKLISIEESNCFWIADNYKDCNVRKNEMDYFISLESRGSWFSIIIEEHLLK